MAVDTRDKRFSLISFGSPIPNVLPNPDGSFNAADRAMLIFLYHGLALSAPVVVVVPTLVTPDERAYNVPFDDRNYDVPFDDRVLYVT